MKKFTKIGLALLLTWAGLSSQFAGAQTQDADAALQKLEALQENLNSLGYYAERVDLGRLLVIGSQNRRLQDLIKAKGLGNMQVLSGYQQLVLSIEYSKAFLRSLKTQGDAQAIANIENLNDQIIKDCGFDDQIVGQLVAGILSQMHNINVQVRGQEVPDDLARWLQGDFDKVVGHALAMARANGDVPSTYEATKAVHDLLVTKYSQLFSVGSRSNAYAMVTELIGLNEFFQEIYSRGDRSLNGAKP